MKAICEMCKLLYNPARLELLLRAYASRDGVNVGGVAEAMQEYGLGVSGVSQYLKQLERIGVLRRERAGMYVNYFADADEAPGKVRRAISAIVAKGCNGAGALIPVFGALMNPFRAKVVSAVARAGAIPAEEICEQTNHQLKYLKRDLQMAVDAGLLDPDDSETSVAVYHYRAPVDETAKLLITLLAA